LRNERAIQAGIKPGTGSLPYKIAALREAHPIFQPGAPALASDRRGRAARSVGGHQDRARQSL